MVIRDIFKKDINRSINGVIKVSQSDEDSIKQELSEYVVTRELQRHFAHFFENYSRALDVPTDKIGVWISGFFGSGKSHFLKMLSYLLSNKVVDGVPAIDYFDGKVKDGMVYASMRRSAEVATEAILFNVDTKGGQWKSGDTARTALLRAFERVFYENRGFFGEDLRLAKLEAFIDESGKTQQFRDVFEKINGAAWVEVRDSYSYFEDDVVEALQKVLGWSKDAAQHWFDGEKDDVIATDTFANQVNEYCEARAAENGGQFRLLFMVDEVGQFIGEDQSLMLSLQTIVEEFGARCGGRVWVMVTSQEAIDEVTMIVGNDFSKIQGRFNTRLSLSSSSVDEVIKRRVLEKTEAATLELGQEYDQQSAVLKNLFTFEDSRGDLLGFESQTDFVESYPFANYQFKVLPDVMTEVRKHGAKAAHMSTGERSMLSAFQESAQAVQEEGTTALVPFWRFFDTISKDLDHGIIQVVSRASDAAEAGRGLAPADVSLLKLLYLIRYIGYLKATVGNLAILMTSDMGADKIALREQVQASLDRLVRENYVARQGDAYNFLTDEEQEIAREIAETQVDSAEVIENIKKTLFANVYTSTALKRGANNFPVDRCVDDSLYGAVQNGMRLNVITLASDLSRASENELVAKSSGQAIVVLDNDKDYYDVLLGVAKVRKYARTKNLAQLPPSTQDIIKAKQNQANFDEREAAKLLEDAVVHASCYIDGGIAKVRSTNAKATFDEVLGQLAESVYSKASYITSPVDSDGDIVRILRGQAERGIAGMGGANEQARKEISGYLATQARLNQRTTMDDVQRKFQGAPFGWREVDIAATVARLVAGQEATLLYGGATVSTEDRNMLNYLRKRTEIGKVEIKRREKLNEKLLKDCRSILEDFTDARDIPTDEDGLVKRVKAELAEAVEQCQKLVREHYSGIRKYPYPYKQAVEDGLHTLSQVLQQQNDAEALLRAFQKEEDGLLDFAEAKQDIDAFFPNQQRLFDASAKLLESIAEEGSYMESNTEAQQAIAQVKEILGSPKPAIPRLNELNKAISKAHDDVVAERRAKLLDALDVELRGLQAYADEQTDQLEAAKTAFSKAQATLENLKTQAHAKKSAQAIDALRFQLDQKASEAQRSINAAVEAARVQAAREIAVPHLEADGSVTEVVYQKPQAAAVSERRVKEVSRIAVCKRKTLESPADVDAYVEALRAELLEYLNDNDAISLM